MFTKSVTVSVAVSKLELFFIKYVAKVNEQYCWDAWTAQRMLDVINTKLITARK